MPGANQAESQFSLSFSSGSNSDNTPSNIKKGIKYKANNLTSAEISFQRKKLCNCIKRGFLVAIKIQASKEKCHRNRKNGNREFDLIIYRELNIALNQMTL